MKLEHGQFGNVSPGPRGPDRRGFLHSVVKAIGAGTAMGAAGLLLSGDSRTAERVKQKAPEFFREALRCEILSAAPEIRTVLEEEVEREPERFGFDEALIKRIYHDAERDTEDQLRSARESKKDPFLDFSAKTRASQTEMNFRSRIYAWVQGIPERVARKSD